jgi:hypothetical protein
MKRVLCTDWTPLIGDLDDARREKLSSFVKFGPRGWIDDRWELGKTVPKCSELFRIVPARCIPDIFINLWRNSDYRPQAGMVAGGISGQKKVGGLSDSRV